jgi:hypothetical protein
MTLNYNKVRELYETKDFDSIPKLEINEVNITLEITPIPKINNRGVSGRIIGSRSLEARWVNSTQAIRKSIWNKKSRYGELGKPYLLAIDVFSLSCDKEDVFDAVFGSEKYIFDWNVTTGKQSSPPKMVRGNDGSWSKSNSTKISGLLIIDDLTPWTLSQKNLSFYINPWAILPYKGKLTYLPHFLPTPDGKLEWRDGCKVREVLEIPELWPEIE